MGLRNTAEELLVRVAASGFLPARWFRPPLPGPDELPGRTGHLNVELVSHCWQYAHLLAYQLSALVRYPPTRCNVQMTVFHAPEDTRTVALLDFFSGIRTPGITWNWQPLQRHHLFRRAIGRNRIARTTSADWVWFTDCDIVFHRDCLDTLADRLQGRRERLLYPREERVTAMLPGHDPLLAGPGEQPGLVDIDPAAFTVLAVPRATGAYQIVHGDVARAAGYCESIGVFQRPAPRWAKTYEDRTFRWLMGTEGEPLELPGVYRIRHVQKGRYGDNPKEAFVRSNIRRAKAWVKERTARRAAGA